MQFLSPIVEVAADLLAVDIPDLFHSSYQFRARGAGLLHYQKKAESGRTSHRKLNNLS